MTLADVNLLVGTPAYNSLVSIDWHISVMELKATGLRSTELLLGNESLITRARNTIISYFHAKQAFTHLLFLDADIYVPGDGIVRLLAAEKDLIGARVPLKSPGAGYSTLEPYGEEEGLLKARKIATGVMLLSRRAAEILIDRAEPYNRGFQVQGVAEDITMYDVFKVGAVGGEYISEDYWACETLFQAGVTGYVDPSIPVRHYGQYPFTGGPEI